jgi:hypothetical protein
MYRCSKTATKKSWAQTEVVQLRNFEANLTIRNILKFGKKLFHFKMHLKIIRYGYTG